MLILAGVVLIVNWNISPAVEYLGLQWLVIGLLWLVNGLSMACYWLVISLLLGLAMDYRAQGWCLLYIEIGLKLLLLL